MSEWVSNTVIGVCVCVCVRVRAYIYLYIYIYIVSDQTVPLEYLTHNMVKSFKS